MTNNIAAGYVIGQLFFGSSATTTRTIGGNSISFFEFSTTWPRIENQSTTLHTINFPFNASTNSGFNMELVASSGNIDFGGTINNNGRIIQIYGNNTAIDAANRSIRLGGVVSGAGALNVSQFGAVKLNATHTYTGNTEIDNGELWIETIGNAIANNSIFVGNGGQLANVTKLFLSRLAGGTAFSRSININPGNASTRFIGSLNTSGTNTFSGSILRSAGGRPLNIEVVNAGGVLAISGVINGSDAITKVGPGTLTLSGTNTYTGGTVIAEGTVSASTAANLGDATGAITLGNGATTGTLNITSSLSRTAISVIDASLAGVINVASGQTFTLTTLNTASGTNNTTKIGKDGTGTLTLSGAGTYVGQTQIGNGSVIVSNNAGFGTNNSTTTRGIDLGLNVGDVEQANNVSALATTGITVPQSIYVAPNTSSATRTIGLSGASGTATFNNEIFLGGTLTVAGTGTVVLSGRLTNTGGLISTATTTTLSNSANNFTGTTTIQSGSELRLNPSANATYDSQVVLNGGILSTTAITSGRNFTSSSTLNLTASSTIQLSASAHTLTFAASNGVSWTAGATLNISNWAGAYNGTAGTAGRIFVSNSSSGLTSTQLSQITFFDGTNYYQATLLGTGELVASATVASLFWGGSGAWATATPWGLVTGGPYTTAWTSGRAAIFNVVNSTITGATTNVASITANENVTVTAGGTLGTGGTIAPIFVASGKTFDFGGQSLSTAAGTGLIKNGTGTLSGQGSAYPGGFILNEGMVAAGGVNIMGGAALNTLTINGGTIAGTGNRTFSGKFPAGIAIGGDFTLGSSVSPASVTATLLFDNNTSLGTSTTRTVTLGGTGLISWNGIISGTNSNLVVAATAAGTLSLGNANTYGGYTRLNGGTLTLGANNAIPVAATGGGVIFGGGTLNTGTARSEGVVSSTNMGTLTLLENSSLVFGSTNTHNLYFAASNAVSWTVSKTLTITNWAGTNGVTGTGGKIFVGASASGLTSAQLAQITINGLSVTQLSSGEIVPVPPTITTSGALSAVSTIYGSASASPSTFSVSGTNMTAGILVTPPSTNFEVSTTIGSGYANTITVGAAGTIASTPIYIRLKAIATVAGSPYTGNVVLTSAGAANVNVATVSSTVTPAPLTITGIASANKVYNGDAIGSLTGTAAYSGLQNGENPAITGTPVATFAQSTVGTNIVVTVTGYTAPTANYTVTQPTVANRDITAKPLTITGVTADNKVIDGNDTATLSGTATLNGVITADLANVTLGGTYSATFPQTTPGTGLAVTVTGYTISGAAAGNYSLSQPTGLTADITSTPTPVINSALTASATYGVAIISYFITATNTPTSFNATVLPAGLSVNPTTGEISGTPTVVGSFNITITATNAGGSGNATLVMTIAQKTLTVSGATADNKVYTRTNPATISGFTLVGVVGGDVVTISNTGTFATVNVGTGIVVTSTQTISGADASKYILTVPTGLTADITPKALTVSGAIVTPKVYNGLNPATITGATLVGIVSPDVVTVSGNGIFVSTDVANGILVTPSLTLAGADAGNYTLTQPTLTGNITAAPLTIAGLTGDDRVYNGTNVATLTGVAAYVGLQNGETFSVTGTPNATFANKNIGNSKPITVTGYTAPTGNYTVSQPTGLTANITVAPLTITGATAANRVYNATTIVNVGGTLSGILLSDVVTLNTTGTMVDANVGTGKAVTFSITGTDATNYSLTQPGTTVDIAQASQTITFGALPAKTTADVPFNAGATSATSGVNALAYSSSTPSVATINATTGLITILGAGTTTITVSQPGNSNYIDATDVSQVLTVTLAPVAIYREDYGTSSTVVLPYSYGTNATGSGILNSNLSTPSWNQTLASANFAGSSGGSMSATIPTSGGSNVITSTFNIATGFQLIPTSIAYNYRVSSTGPQTLNVGISGTGGSTSISQVAVTRSGAFLGVTTSNFLSTTQNLTGTVTLTFTLATSTGTNSTTRLDDITLSGNVICIQPAIYTVTGGGSYCSGGSGVAVGLSNSQTGINYQLVRGGFTNVGSPVAGTGSSISFSNQSVAGTYTVVASNTNSGCNLSATMSGSAAVTVTNTNTWTGGTNTFWTTASNWSCGLAPTSATDVVIGTSTNDPIITSDVAINSLTINSSETLTVNTGNDLTVTAAIVNNGGTLTIENNANLMQGGTTNTNSGNVVVKRNSSLLKRLDYTLWSSPVTGQGLYAFSKFTLNNRFYVYNTATDSYSNSVGFNFNGTLQYPSPLDPLSGNGVDGVDGPPAVQFVTGKGYLIRVPYNHPTTPTVYNGSFTGVANNGDITTPISTALNGFNAVGNPYPSRLNVWNFIDDNANITGPLYFWRKTNTTAVSTSYATLTKAAYVANGSAGGDTGSGFFQTLLDNPSGNPADWVINIGQGFIVKATSGSTISFTNSMRRSLNADQFFRDSQTVNTVNNGLYWLNLKDTTGVYSQMAVGYSSEGTLGFDRGIDGENINNEFYLTSLIGADEYAIQGRPDFDSSDIVPLSYKAVAAGNYTIAIDHTAGGFTSGSQPIYLKDNLTATLHDLNTGAYTFVSDAGTFNSRFEIVYALPLGVDNPVFTANNVIIYSQNNGFVVNSGAIIMDSIKVFDIRGRLLETKKGINASETIIGAGLANEVLLVQITSEDGVVVTKKVVR